MADKQQSTGGNNTAANDEIKTTSDIFEAARKYKQTKDALAALAAQEVIFENAEPPAQAAQEKQEKRRVLANNGIEIDPKTGNYIIKINTNLDPALAAKLKPNSPQFDPELYKEHTAAAMQRLQASLDQIHNTLDVFKAGIAIDTMQNVAESMKKIVEPNKNAINMTINSFKKLATAMRYLLENSEAIQERMTEWEKLEPFLEAELKKPKYKGITLNELLETEDTGKDSLLDKAIAAAKAAQLAKELPQITITEKGVASVEYPVDKVNNNIWTLSKDAYKSGRITLTFAAEKRGSSKTADINYSLDFDALEQENGVTITKKLTAFDKRCYIAVSALFNGGFEVATVAQIYAAMGNNGRPSAADIKKINDSLTKMQAAHIYLNNESEHKLYPKYSKFVYDASLLPIERISAVVNGQTVDGAIHLFREPPLVTFAKDKKQITTVSRRLLESPLSKTDANLQLDDYLIDRISHIKKKKGKMSNKLLYTTIFERADITTQKQRVRAKKKISKYLEHYTQCRFIKGYKEAADGVTILY